MTFPLIGASYHEPSLTIFSMSLMPVLPLIGTTFALHGLRPFHSAVLCDAVIIMLPSALSVPFAKYVIGVEHKPILITSAPAEFMPFVRASKSPFE